MNTSETKLLRLPDVLKRIPISKSSWWNGIKTGKYPKPIKLGQRTSCWRSVDVDEIVAAGEVRHDT